MHVVTAHQASDNAETLLQRLRRGTGMRGLGGIRPKRELASGVYFVSPLLCVTREQIEAYLRERGLEWRLDRTNLDCSYRRNFIRHRLLPELQSRCTGSLVDGLRELSESSRRFYVHVCKLADRVWDKVSFNNEGAAVLDRMKLVAQPEPVAVELIRRCLKSVGTGERDFTRRHYEKILALAGQNKSGQQYHLPDNTVVSVGYSRLRFERVEKQIDSCPRPESAVLQIPGKIKFGGYKISTDTNEAKKYDLQQILHNADKSNEYFDLDKIKMPLTLRRRREGDRFRPLGLCGSKKIGKFLTAAKVPKATRCKALVIADRDDIIWLWPVRISEKARITDQTSRILRISVSECC